jgi:YHS domain-containing protein
MKLWITLTCLCFFFLSVANAQPTRQQKHFNVKNNLALDGYDPVSYFTGQPRDGTKEFKLSYRGVIYYFSSAENMNTFKANPAKYEPVYGGWCAYAMGVSGEKVKVDPETFKILDGKLYLFYNFWGNNTLIDWNENEKKLREAADGHWSKIIQ